GPIFPAGRNRVDDLVGLEIDHLDGAITIANPGLVAVLDDQHAIRPRRVVTLLHTNESAYAGDERVFDRVENIQALVGSIAEIIAMRGLIHKADVETIERIARHIDLTYLLQFS